MVKFGERLPGLMRKGWESKYIDYAKLKRIIENMSGDAKASDDFFSNLEQEIAKVDTFVASTVNDLRKQFGSDESTKAANAKKVQKELAVLRSYVGTNIVAATKRWLLWSLDVSQAFLKGLTFEQVSKLSEFESSIERK